MFSDMYDTWPSDGRLKENIKNIESALHKIKLLNPVQYDIKDSFYKELNIKTNGENVKISKGKLGFVAQELQEVLPDLVHTEPTTGYYSISTMEIIPVLVKAVQEQQEIIEQLEADINVIQQDCCNQSESLKSGSVKSSETDSEVNEAKLYQNAPNPFNVHLFCAAIRSLKKVMLIINILRMQILFFGSCGAIFRACLFEEIRTGVVQ